MLSGDEQYTKLQSLIDPTSARTHNSLYSRQAPNNYLSEAILLIMLLMASACLSYCIECSLGRYGFNCNQSCDGCLSDACDNENGTCINTPGCKPGWQYGHPKCDKGILNNYCTSSFS